MPSYTFHFEQVEHYWPAFVHGFVETLLLSIWSAVLCLLIVLAVYMLRFSLPEMFRSTVSGMTRIYIDLMQSLPVLVLLVWVYFGLPLLGLDISADEATIFVLGTSFSAFALDLLMGAEQAIPREQVHVGTIHGMNSATVVGRIYLPTILRSTADPLVGQFISVLKLSTFASIIGSQEVLSAANSVIAITYRPLETYGMVALIFVISIVPVNLVRRLRAHRVQADDLG